MDSVKPREISEETKSRIALKIVTDLVLRDAKGMRGEILPVKQPYGNIKKPMTTNRF